MRMMHEIDKKIIDFTKTIKKGHFEKYDIEAEFFEATKDEELI